jgi:uncharacterized protein (TIGR03437 family)
MLHSLVALVLFQPHYVAVLNNQSARGMAVDATGSAWVATNLNQHCRLTKLDPDGNQVFSSDIGLVDARAVAVDAAGNAYLAASTTTGIGQMVVVKFDPTGKIVFQTTIGTGYVAAITIDAEGSTYLTGFANSSGLTATAGAFQPISKGSDAFILKLNPAGTQAVYSTFLGGTGAHCEGSSCETFPPYGDDDQGQAIAVDAAGNAYVAGRSNSRDFPTTPNAFQRSCPCLVPNDSAWVAKLNPIGSALVYSTFVSGGSDAANSLAVDATGSAYVTGTTNLTSFPTTPGAYSTKPELRSERNAFLSKLNPDGSALEYSTYLGPGSGMNLALDPAGNVAVTGTSASAGFPVSPGAFSRGSSYLTFVNASGSALLYSTLLPEGVGGAIVGLDAGGNAVVLGASAEQGIDSSAFYVPVHEGGIVLRLTAGVEPAPTLLGVMNLNSFTAATQLVPGEIVTLFGTSLGPDEWPIGGSSPTIVAVYFNGIAAPLLYVGAQQIYAIVPFEVGTEGNVTVTVSTGSQVSNEITFPLAAAEPRLFAYGSGVTLAFNEDGTQNSFRNPAKAGTVLTVYATAMGLTDPPEVDGTFGLAGARPILPVTCLLGDVTGPIRSLPPCTVISARSNPSYVAGVTEIKIRLPLDLNSMSSQPYFEIVAGGIPSVARTISVRP